MSKEERLMTILMADDDEDDCIMTGEALKEAGVKNDMVFAQNGEELLDYLRHQGKYSQSDSAVPDIILLDLNMPKMDGREALKELKGDLQLKKIPVIVLTTSKSMEDIVKTYDLGTNSFIVKPTTFKELVEIMNVLSRYWMDIVELPKVG